MRLSETVDILHAPTTAPAVTSQPRDLKRSLPAATFESSRSWSDSLARILMHLPKSVWAIMDVISVCLGNYIGYQFFRLQFPTSTWVADMTLVNAVVRGGVVDPVSGLGG